jgi:hypothetical protein
VIEGVKCSFRERVPEATNLAIDCASACAPDRNR